MKRSGPAQDDPAGQPAEGEQRAFGGAQTPIRGLDILSAVRAAGTFALPDLASVIGLSRSTTHRLASSLVDQRFLHFRPPAGFTLGPKVLELEFLAHRQATLPQIAREHLERLAALTEDTVNLGIRDGMQAVYLDRISGRRRVEVASHVGDRLSLQTTGIGKALILDASQAEWEGVADHDPHCDPAYRSRWIERMRHYAQAGHAFDLEENEDHLRCVAAPIRNAQGTIVAAISVTALAQYMDDPRMAILTVIVLDTAAAIECELGWNGH